MGFFARLFGADTPNAAVSNLLERGAVVVDVRSPGEFAAGHMAGAVNCPLQTLAGDVAELKRLDKPVVLCCRSGARSAQAVQVLAKAGLEVVNGGSWQSVQKAANKSPSA